MSNVQHDGPVPSRIIEALVRDVAIEALCGGSHDWGEWTRWSNDSNGRLDDSKGRREGGFPVREFDGDPGLTDEELADLSQYLRIVAA